MDDRIYSGFHPRRFGERNKVTVKPIFHFMLGSRIGLDPQREHFTLRISTRWYLKALVKPCSMMAKGSIVA